MARHRCRALFALALMFGLAGCGTPSSTREALPEIAAALEPHGTEVEPSDTRALVLGWRPPTSDCSHAYEISTQHDPPLANEPDTPSLVVLAPSPPPANERRSSRPTHDAFTGAVYYRGVRAERAELVREWALSKRFAGPASPTAACTPKTWDPIEDFFALAFPMLPGRLTAVGESWPGLRVEGRCNRSACVDPQTGGGGEGTHHLTCVTMSWRDTLRGVYSLRSAGADEAQDDYALIESEWNDGQGEAGIRTRRLVLVSAEHGRPVWGQVVIDYPWPVGPTRDNRFAPVKRTWTFVSVDACPGSLAAAGGVPAVGSDVAAKLQAAKERLATPGAAANNAAPALMNEDQSAPNPPE